MVFVWLHYKVTEKVALSNVQFDTFHVVPPLFTTTSVVTSNPNPNKNLTLTQTQILALSLTSTLTLTCQIWYGGKKCPFISSTNIYGKSVKCIGLQEFLQLSFTK